MANTTHPSLLEQLRDGGDPLAWDEFFSRYGPVVYRYARGRGCAEHTAEEIVQEVMLKVFRYCDTFLHDRRQGRFRGWLAQVVRNQVAEYRRRPSARVRASGGDDLPIEPESDEPPAGEAWEEAFEGGLLLVLLDVVRCEADPQDYLAFELVSISGLSPEEAARITGLSRNAVYKARRRLLARLRELAGPYDEGRLHQRVREALVACPAPARQRSLNRWVEESLASHGDRP
ncbi:MAG: sigma-70 family RNA polymerase sigma factor [Thermoguttaceae bacterium]|nr:sigma-70 family RNA polymerase sigma factor [Thermoguttaceae bacterium]